jgi:hypothetical protein
MNDDDQLPMPGPSKGECEGNQDKCNAVGCPLFGNVGRESRDGKHRVRGCGDPVARGKRNKRKGQRKQAKAANIVGVPKSSLHPGHEEFYGGKVRIEVKAGKQVGPVHTRWLSVYAQSEASRPYGDNRPFIGMFMPDGVSYGIVMFRTDHIEDVVTALWEQLMGDEQ